MTTESRILIVDDDPGIVRVLTHILKDMAKIHFTTMGSEALNLALQVKPDLIIMDIEMPDMNGIDVCEQIKSDTGFRDIPILFVTSHVDMALETRVLMAGAIDFITKPPHPSVIHARVANYLQLKHQTTRLRMLSAMDGLTGIANRRTFDSALAQEWQRSCRSGSPLSLLMLDIDFFKQYNDTYGHLAGDNCLRAVAKQIAVSVKRPGELVARYGGEEFAVILPDCSYEHAIALAEIIRSGVFDLGIAHATSTVAPKVTVSIGVASMHSLCENSVRCWRTEGCYHSGIPCGMSQNNLIKVVDDLLYIAKRSGRNRIGFSDSPAPVELKQAFEL